MAVSDDVSRLILLKPTMGEKPTTDGGNPYNMWLARGELVTEIPEKDQVPRSNGHPHNYRKLAEPDVTFYNDGTDTAPLHKAEADYLLGVEKAATRIQEYLKPNKLKEIMDLKINDVVLFRLDRGNVNKMIRGRVKYYGAIPGSKGVQFGIEILDKEHKGHGYTDGNPYFFSDRNNGVWVSMDGIVKKSYNQQYADKSQEDQAVLDKQPRREQGHSYDTRSKNAQTEKKENFVQRFLGIKNTSPAVRAVDKSPADQYQYQFAVNDHVIIQTAQDEAIRGIVRWTGPIRLSKKSDATLAIAVGVETNRTISVEEAFPDMHMNVTGSHGQELFSVPSHHSRVYLPEALVLHDEDYNVMKQEAEQHDVIEAKKLGISTEEYRHQKEYIALAAEQNDQRIAKRIEEQKRKDNLEEEATLGAGEYNQGNVEVTLPDGQSIEYLMKDEDLMRKQYELLAQAQSVRSEAEQQGTDYEGQKSASSRHEVSSQYPVQSSNSGLVTQDNRYGRYNSHPGSSSSTPQQPRANASPSASHYQFAEGSMVVARNTYGPPMYGVVKWLGRLPNMNGEYAGVELDTYFEGCTDGTWKGKAYFHCPRGKGYFCPLESLEADERYSEHTGKENPLIEIPLEEEEDTLGGPELFSRYIGDSHGIQGHQNSCYLDSAVFGLFALSDSFDDLLLEEPNDQLGEEIKHILWKGIVNPMRKYGVARHESIMKLRNKLEEYGKMKGANKDEKDPEEFLNLLFKGVLHIKPFLTIMRPFGVEEEFFVQLFFEMDPNQKSIPTTEKLIVKMFHEQKISFTQIPSKLLLQMPRFGKEFKMYNRIIPALTLDTKPLLTPECVGEQTCFLCLDATATRSCSECVNVVVTEKSSVPYCDKCSDIIHNKRKHEKVEFFGNVNKMSKMDLLSVICIETSHYVCFTRDRTKDRWLFHDSMANRIYDMYNIPCVTDVTDMLQKWVYNPASHQRLLNAGNKEIPEIVRRFTGDIYMCVYVNPTMDIYGHGPVLNC